jgi:heme/copper-type cytochrome/quinol oxidase subunit 4
MNNNNTQLPQTRIIFKLIDGVVNTLGKLERFLTTPEGADCAWASMVIGATVSSIFFFVAGILWTVTSGEYLGGGSFASPKSVHVTAIIMFWMAFILLIITFLFVPAAHPSRVWTVIEEGGEMRRRRVGAEGGGGGAEDVMA